MSCIGVTNYKTEALKPLIEMKDVHIFDNENILNTLSTEIKTILEDILDICAIDFSMNNLTGFSKRQTEDNGYAIKLLSNQNFILELRIATNGKKFYSKNSVITIFKDSV